MPYTFAFMIGTNKILEKNGHGGAMGTEDNEGEREDQKRMLGSDKVALLLMRWERLNMIRSILPLAGASMEVLVLFPG